MDTAVEAIVTIDERGRIDFANPAAGRMFGWEPEALVGRNVSVLMPEPFRGQHDGYLEAYHNTGHRRIIGIGREAFGQRRDGTIFPIDLSVGEFSVGGRRLFTGIIRDITERRRLQAEVLRISELEQSRLGRDLHDDLCQQLAGIEFLSQTVARQLGQAGRPEAAAVEEISRLIREATEHTRDLSHSLSPVRLEAEGLADALEELAVRTEKRFGIPVQFTLHGRIGRVPAEVGHHLFRIAQEAIQNALKHARASRLEIGLASVGTRIHLAIRDDGRGLPKRPARGSGIGLRIMQYRAGMIGASLLVQNEPTGGVVVACTVHHAIHARPRKKAAPPASRSPRPTGGDAG